MASVLLSYARADGLGASARLRGELEQAGHGVWRDIEAMRGGENWKDQLRQAIREVDVVVVLLTPAAVASRHVLWECDTAQTLGTHLIGVLIAPCTVPDDLAQLHYHDLSTPERYVLGFASLLRDLNERSAASPSAQTAPPATGGASKFDLSHATIENGQIGDGNIQYNNPRNLPETHLIDQLMQRIMHALKDEHQHLRLLLITELQAMSAEQRQQVEMIFDHYQHGQLSSQQVAAFMQDVRQMLTALQQSSLSTQNESVAISRQLAQVFAANLAQQHQLELTLPILPGIFAYKYTFGGTLDADLRNLIDHLQATWQGWQAPN